MRAFLGDLGKVYESPSFDVLPGQPDARHPFTLKRPEHGELRKSWHHGLDLYGRVLRVEARVGRWHKATDEVRGDTPRQ